MRAAVDMCVTAPRLDAIPRFVRCLAAEQLRRAVPAHQHLGLRAKLASDLPDPRPDDLQAAMRADRSPFASAPALTLRLDEHDADHRWLGGKPSDLMMGNSAAAAPVSGAASRQQGSIKLLLLMQRDQTSGKVRCLVVNGSGQPLSKQQERALTAALTKGDPQLQADSVSFHQSAVSMAAGAEPTTLYSVLLRGLGESADVEWTPMEDALRRFDETLARLKDEELQDLMACEAAWLHAMADQHPAAGGLDREHLYQALDADAPSGF
jgi:hypothetical protein